MFMQKIRRATKKNRGILIAIIGLLVVGLLSSVAFMGPIGGQQQGDPTLDDWITMFEEFVANLDLNNLDFNSARANAGAFMELSQLYWFRFEQGGMAEPEWQAKATDAARQAEELYAQAYTMMPADLSDDARVNFFFNYAAMRETQENFEGALEMLERAAAIQPTNANVQAMIATMYAQLGRMVEATIHFISARDLAPDSVQIVDMYATFLFTFMEPRVAVVEWNNFIEHIGPNHPDYEHAVARRDHFEFLAAMFGLPPGLELDIDDELDDELTNEDDENDEEED